MLHCLRTLSKLSSNVIIKDNAGVLRLAQWERKSHIEQKGAGLVTVGPTRNNETTHYAIVTTLATTVKRLLTQLWLALSLSHL